MARQLGAGTTEVLQARRILEDEGVRFHSESTWSTDTSAAYGPHVLRWRLDSDIPLHFVHSCDSTNRQAARLAPQWTHPLGPSGLCGVVVADHQTSGRGRLDRTWNSEAGHNLLFSVVLRPPVPPVQAPRCVLAWAAALAEALDIHVKWPNDLIDTQDRKLGGLLAELETSSHQVQHLVLGVGVNANQVSFPGLPHAGSLALTRGQPIDRARTLTTLVRSLRACIVNTEDTLATWRSRNRTLGRRVRVGEIEGIAEGLREDGALLVDGRAVLTGDVQLVSGQAPGLQL
ncbi:MAG: biotin--[acetyl-CoA-carboxylase] ligase [Myxococcota bacterium]|nr:biotin--[acetyl-CoA-carboxylase] ligase [Myxococcota bacterium]